MADHQDSSSAGKAAIELIQQARSCDGEVSTAQAGESSSSHPPAANAAKVFPMLKKLQTKCVSGAREKSGPRVGLHMELCGEGDDVDGTVVMVMEEQRASGKWLVQLEADSTIEAEADFFAVQGDHLKHLSDLEHCLLDQLKTKLSIPELVESKFKLQLNLLEVRRTSIPPSLDASIPPLLTLSFGLSLGGRQRPRFSRSSSYFRQSSSYEVISGRGFQ